jgi:triphosphoribosyl-dephospho-CoA synthase
MARNGLFAQLACIWEATARKPGNVHRFVDFADTHYVDFLLSAAAIAPVFDRADQQSVGETILQAVQATRQVVSCNTNLGIILLLAPLAAVPAHETLFPAVARVLHDLTVDDSRRVYQAIRLATPAALGRVGEQDIADEPTLPLRQIMALAAERDLVARQYANEFHEIRDCGLPALLEGMQRFGCLEEAIVHCQLTLLATHPDSLITRKCGLSEAQEASRRAAAVLRASGNLPAARRELDEWLRADGHRRNPGTTADLVTACLFAALREGKIPLPLQVPWSNGKHDD